MTSALENMPDPGPVFLPYLRLLGEPQLQGVPDDAGLPAYGLELLAYLSLVERPTWPQIGQAMYPDRDPEAARRNVRMLMKVTRAALGSGAGSEPLLRRVGHSDGALSSVLRSDWDEFRALIGPDPAEATDAHLAAALGLVAGRPLAVSRRHGRWSWWAAPAEAMYYAIDRAGNELARRALAAGDPALCRYAGKAMQLADPFSESALLAITHAAWMDRDPDLLRAELRAAPDLDGAGMPISSSTQQIIEELLDDLDN